MMRELGIPLLIGAVAGLIVAFIPTGGEADATPAVVEPPHLGVQYLWNDGPAMDDARGQILVLADPDQPADVAWKGPCVDDPLSVVDACPPTSHATIDWHTSQLGTINITQFQIVCIRGPCPQPEAPWNTRLPADQIRFDAANDTLRLSLYAFNADGELLASNARAVDLELFDLYADYIPLSNVRWYLGDGNVSGAQSLPFGSDFAAAALDGLPVGGIATVHVVDHPYSWLVGELWLTGRIDGINA